MEMGVKMDENIKKKIISDFVDVITKHGGMPSAIHKFAKDLEQQAKKEVFDDIELWFNTPYKDNRAMYNALDLMKKKHKVVSIK